MRGQLVAALAAVGLLLIWLCSLHSLPAPRPGGDDRLSSYRRAAVLRAAKRWQTNANVVQQQTVHTSAREAAKVAAAREIVAATPVSTASTSANCPASRRPYHVLLTASSGSYQTWQTRLFYYHYVRMKSLAGPCSEVGGFTRLLTQPSGTPRDDLASEMRTIVVTELNAKETLGFVVLNRPHSVRTRQLKLWTCPTVAVLTRSLVCAQVLVALQRGDLKWDEDYVLITETDHLMLKPMPNLAKPDLAVGYPFHYMLPTRNPRTIELIRRFAGSRAVADAVQQVGPSPILIHNKQLAALTKPW